MPIRLLALALALATAVPSSSGAGSRFEPLFTGRTLRFSYFHGGTAKEEHISLGGLRLSQRLVAAVMVLAYLLWALGGDNSWMRAWHLASVIPLAAALIRFDRLAGRADGKPVEDLISRDGLMVGCELAWLVTFTVGLW